MSSTKYWGFSNPISICMYERCYQPLWINMTEAVGFNLDHKLIGVYVDINTRLRNTTFGQHIKSRYLETNEGGGK